MVSTREPEVTVAFFGFRSGIRAENIKVFGENDETLRKQRVDGDEQTEAR